MPERNSGVWQGSNEKIITIKSAGGVLYWATESGKVRYVSPVGAETKIDALLAEIVPIIGLDVSPDGSLLIAGRQDGTVKLIQTNQRRVITTFRGESEIRCCKVLSDQRTILVGEKSGRLHFL